MGKNVAEGNDETAGKKDTYCTACKYLGDIPLAHVAVNIWRVSNTARREKALSGWKNVAQGNDETGEGMNTYWHAY